jgi:hypothetical protein
MKVGTMNRKLCAAVAAGLMLAAPAAANDSTAALGAGGIVLTESNDIRMATEDLFISQKVVRVNYTFANDTNAPITTRVAFPLPEADLEALTESDVGWQTEDTKNVVDFRLKVGGKSVKPALEEKAIFKGKDVTAQLKKLGVPIIPRAYQVADAIKRLPAAAKAELKRDGLAEIEADWVSPKWTVKNTYHWMQTFPPKKPLAVTHEYKPVVGGSFLPASFVFDKPPQLQTDEYYKGYCVDDGTLAAIGNRMKAVQKKQGEHAMMLTWWVDYVLTTGKNWKGPIGKFKLTIDKGSPDNVISLCFDGIRKTGRTTFIAERTDFEPEQDLKLMIVAAPEG